MQTYDVHPRTRSDQPTAVVEATLSVPEIGPWLGKTYHAVAELMASQGIRPAGPPYARYHMLGEDRFQVEAGFPVSKAVAPDGEVRPSTLPGGPVAETTHIGPYDAMQPAYEAIAAWIREHGGEPVGDPWEIYFSDPVQQPDPGTWRTEIIQPYRPA
jgi:effector-binding domain-containing protein